MDKTKPFKFYCLPVLFLISLLGYGIIAYTIKRSNFLVFITIFSALFLCYYLSIKWIETKREFKWAVGAAILFRLILLFALPNLSDDFYRFIWDGNLLIHHINPFIHTPEFYLQHSLPNFLSAELFQNLNSQAYYSIYPPVSQYIYGVSASFSGINLLGNVVIMKLIMLTTEIGTFLLIKKLLFHFELSKKWLLIYALNPLIILELTGNLHFEGVMIFFLLLAYYLFLKNKFWSAAVCFLLAVNTKLIPLLLLPYLIFSLSWKRSATLAGILIAGTLILHIPFLDPAFINHFSSSLSLYFQSFEFNASIYYLIRWIGFQVEGYNIIQTAAPWMALLSSLIIITLSWIYRQSSLKNLPVMYIVFLGVYYILSTTVHPWYITSLVAFVPVAGIGFPLVWSAVIPLTYITYTTTAYTENLWLVTLEYMIVFVVISYDFYRQKESLKQKLVRLFPQSPSFNKLN